MAGRAPFGLRPSAVRALDVAVLDHGHRRVERVAHVVRLWIDREFEVDERLCAAEQGRDYGPAARRSSRASVAVAEVDREHGLPTGPRKGRARAPHERRRGRCEQDRRAAALAAQELARRALEPARPRGWPRSEFRGGHHPSAALTARRRSARYAISRLREAVEDSGTSSLELSRVSRLRPVS
jgi:hypothetical protein